jgi:NTP pyrophosphatase (non-canonical NTP hydrolase)
VSSSNQYAFDFYQREAEQFALYEADAKILYAALGLCSEAGEVAGKIKKWIRGDGHLVVEDLAKELGDVLWYVSALASDLGLNLSEVAEENITKLNSRHLRNKLRGDGDNR